MILSTLRLTPAKPSETHARILKHMRESCGYELIDIWSPFLFFLTEHLIFEGI